MYCHLGRSWIVDMISFMFVVAFLFVGLQLFSLMVVYGGGPACDCCRN